MDTHKQQASERIKQANNILVTVSSNPSVDQLAALVGLTVSLNKLGKHATAVFSGNVPSTLEFLQPEKTIEKNTDSLRDFIIALDKAKADKLRYKVEDRVVKIFITPYRTSISDKDLEFSQGDFNVDVVLALGVHNQAELDQAITSHGRILHDASIITLNVKPGGELGSINWLEPSASSLSEIAVQLVNALDKNLIDTQVATAFLTGIVAETERFSNSKTTPQTMSISAQLMSSGANQQLVATKLEEPVAPSPTPAAPIAIQAPDTQSTPQPVKKSNDGTLEIAHDETKRPEEEVAEEQKEPAEKPVEPPIIEEVPVEPTPPPPPAPQIRIDEHGSLSPVDKDEDEDILPPLVRTKTPEISHHHEAPKMIEPPASSGALLSDDGDSEDKASGLPGMPVEEGDHPASMDEAEPSVGPTILPPPEEDEKNAPGTSFLGDQPLVEDADQAPETATTAGKTLTDLEREVGSSHLTEDITPAAEPKDTSPAATSSQPTDSEIKAAEEDPIVSAFNGANTGAMLPPVAADLPGVPVTVPTPIADDSSIPNMPVPPAEPAQPPVAPTLDTARDAVAQAMAGQGGTLEPPQALNAQPLNLQLGGPAPTIPEPAVVNPSLPQPAVVAGIPEPVNPTQSDYGVPAMPVYSQQPTGGIQLPTVNNSTVPPSNPPPMMPPPAPPAMQ